MTVAREALPAPTDAVARGAVEAVVRELESECARLLTFLSAVEVIGEMTPRSLDAVIGVGELLACRLFVAVLQSLVCMPLLPPPPRVAAAR